MTQALTRIETRLPYRPEAGDLGFNEASWKVLTESIWPLAKEPSSILLALAYCQARKLDPFKRPVHIVPVWSSQLKKMVETVWPSISELRTTAHRTKSYAGCDAVAFGPTKMEEFKGTKKGENGERNNVTIRLEYPEWAQITVYRKMGRQRVSFVGPVVRWKEAYARASANSDLPNDQWQKRPFGQLEKCAEAAALRKAFPEEITDYSAEEMEGQILGNQPIEEPKTIQIVKPSGKAADIVASIRATEPLEGTITQKDEELTPEAPLPAVQGDPEPEPFTLDLTEQGSDSAHPELEGPLNGTISKDTADEVIETYMAARGVNAKVAEEQIRSALWKRYNIENLTDLPLVSLQDVLNWAKLPPAKRGRG